MAGFWRALLGREPEQQKESAAGPLISMQQMGRAVHTPRDYENIAKEAYQRNIVAYRCIALLAESASCIPWVLYRGDQEQEGHPLLESLSRPNPFQSGTDLLEAIYSYRLLSGNSYIERAIAGQSMELYALRPDRMKVIAGSRGWPSAYEYKLGGRTQTWPVDPIRGTSDVLHWKTFSPVSDWYGQAPLEAAGYAVDQHNAASKWNLSVLQNGAKPSGALQYKPKEGSSTLTDDQFMRLRAELDDMGAQSGKTGRPMLLDGGLEWVQMMLTQSDVDWLAGIDKTASQIAQAFNVPEQLVGVPGQQTYNNYREARLALYEDAVLPMVYSLAHSLTEWLVQPALGPQYRLSIDEDNIPALAPRKEQQFERLNSATFLTLNEKREALGYEPVEGGDTIMVSAGMLPLSFAAEPPDIGQPDLPVERAAQAAYGKK